MTLRLPVFLSTPVVIRLLDLEGLGSLRAAICRSNNTESPEFLCHVGQKELFWVSFIAVWRVDAA
jgi:hypothetical protein